MVRECTLFAAGFVRFMSREVTFIDVVVVVCHKEYRNVPHTICMKIIVVSLGGVHITNQRRRPGLLSPPAELHFPAEGLRERKLPSGVDGPQQVSNDQR